MEGSEPYAVEWPNFLPLVEKAIISLIPPLKGKTKVGKGKLLFLNTTSYI